MRDDKNEVVEVYVWLGKAFEELGYRELVGLLGDVLSGRAPLSSLRGGAS